MEGFSFGQLLIFMSKKMFCIIKDRSIRVEKLPLGLGVNDWRYSKSPQMDIGVNTNMDDRGLLVRQILATLLFKTSQKNLG